MKIVKGWINGSVGQLAVQLTVNQPPSGIVGSSPTAPTVFRRCPTRWTVNPVVVKYSCGGGLRGFDSLISD